MAKGSGIVYLIMGAGGHWILVVSHMSVILKGNNLTGECHRNYLDSSEEDINWSSKNEI